MQVALPRCPGFCLLNIMAAFCERPSMLISHTSNCKKGSVCCDNTKAATTQRPRPQTRKPNPTTTTTQAPSTTTSAPDPREECPGSCIVSLLSFTCFRNAEMSDLFKCKKSGTTCCASKSKILEVQGAMDKSVRNATYPLNGPNPNANQINPNNQNYPPQQFYNGYQPYQPNKGYEPTVSPQAAQQQLASSPALDTMSSTSPRPPPVYSKYVCGVKGTSRAAKSFLTMNHTSRVKRDIEVENELMMLYKTKSTERLVLGSSLVPIPIVYNDYNSQVPDEIMNYDPTSADNEASQYRVSNHRQSRVVGGEDGDNGEWCWQVALINSLNQYLCGGALIG